MSHCPVELCKTLIACPSITPDDAGCLDILAAHLQPLGFELTRFDCHGVSNLWARRGHQAPLLVFAGHTDVVPTGARDAWRSDPFTATEHNGLLYGRGAADMKGSLAAMIVAIEQFLTQHAEHAGSLGLLLTSDEEGEARYGTRYVIEQLQKQQVSIDYCVVGEPSSHQRLADTIRVGRRGSLHLTLTLKGKQGHVAYPELAVNPIHQLGPLLTELSETKWDEGTDLFPATTFQCSNVAAGTGANNVIPGELVLQANFRFAPCSSVDSLQQQVARILERHALNIELDWHLSAEPFYTPPGRLRDVVHQAIETVTGQTPIDSTHGGTSDGRFIAPLGVELIELGPINATIHQVNECVASSDLMRLADVYRVIIERLLAN